MHYRSKTNFPELFTRSGKTGGIQIQRYQGFAVEDYGFTLGALTLYTSGFCNVRVSFVMVRSDPSYNIYRVRPETVKLGRGQGLSPGQAFSIGANDGLHPCLSDRAAAK